MAGHPQPWMDDPKGVTPETLQMIIAGSNDVVSLPSRGMDEVFPGLYIGERGAAINVLGLQGRKFTHVLNVAMGKTPYHCNTNHVMYQKVGIKFMGIEADDTVMFNLLPFLQKTSDFIHKALNSPEGKILVHCRAGASRSATVTIAYLMLKQNKSAVEATKTVRSKREICPNSGFLRQLCILQDQIDNGERIRSKRSCILF